MTNKPCKTFGLPTNLPETISPGPSRDAETHEDLRLDQAPAETFSAGNSAAASPRDLLNPSHPGKPQETEEASKSPNCRIGIDSHLDPAALETFFDCQRCNTKIPASVAMSLDGPDYIYHFCGAQCIEAWCKKIDQL